MNEEVSRDMTGKADGMNRSLFIILVFQHIQVVLLAVFQFCFDNNNELHLFL